jgi:hypothetical protein
MNDRHDEYLDEYLKDALDTGRLQALGDYEFYLAAPTPPAVRELAAEAQSLGLIVLDGEPRSFGGGTYGITAYGTWRHDRLERWALWDSLCDSHGGFVQGCGVIIPGAEGTR